jgi:hypothetical protein
MQINTTEKIKKGRTMDMTAKKTPNTMIVIRDITS